MPANIAAPGIKYAPRALNAVFGSDGSREAATRILQLTTRTRQPANIQLMANILKELVKTHPDLARNAYANLNSRLRPTQQGELQRLVGNSLSNPNKQAVALKMVDQIELGPTHTPFVPSEVEGPVRAKPRTS